MKTPNTDHEIETMLGRLVPAAPSEDLMARLRASRPAAPVGKVIRFSRWVPLAAAAVVGLAFALHRQPVPEIGSVVQQNQTAPRPVPVESRQHLMQVTDFGVVDDVHDKPVRLIGTTWVDEIVYASAPDGKPITESRVRQEVLPVSLDVF